MTVANKESYLRMLPSGIREPLRKLFDSNAPITNTINMSKAATTAMSVTSTVAKGIDFTDATLTNGWDNGFFVCGSGNGSSGDQHSITATGFYIPLQINMASVANPSAVSHFTCAMLRTDIITADQANSLANPLAIRGDIQYDVYGIEGINVDMGITKDIAVTTGVNAAYFQLTGDGAITNTARNQVLGAAYRGTSGSSGIDFVSSFHMNAPDCSVSAILNVRQVQGTATVGVQLEGTMAKGFDATNMTLTQGWDNGMFLVGSGNGSSGTQFSVAATGMILPIQVNMVSTSNPTAVSHFTCAMFRTDISTTDQANSLANPLAIRADIAYNVYGIEGINCDMSITDDITVTTGVNSAYFSLTGDGAITNTAENQVLCATYRGTNGSSGIDHVAAFHMNAPDCSVTNILQLANYQGTVTNGISFSGNITNPFDFASTDGSQGAAKGTYSSCGETTTPEGYLKVDVGGNTMYAYLYDDIVTFS